MGEPAVTNQNAQENIDNNAVDSNLKIQNYDPVSDICNTTGTVVPLALKYEQARALETVERRVNGLDIYVQEKLEYPELGALCTMFSAEQVDSVALAIYNYEKNGVATIVGDGTGVGKGRQASAIIRYAHKNNLIPVFITEKPNLFTDIYRDLIDIKTDDGIILKKLLSEKKKQRKRINRKDVETQIIDDINNGEFTLDYNISNLQENLNADSTAFNATFKKTDTYKKLINEYMDLFFTNEFEEVENYIANKDYDEQVKKAKNRMVPFVVNGRTNKTIIQDKAGNIIYEPVTSNVNNVIRSGEFELYEDGDVIMATYSQFRSTKPNMKKDWLMRIAPKCLFILDESHNAAGASNTGAYFGELIMASKGAIYFSATFAKRPDNMPIYAGRTSIGDAGLNMDQLIAAFAKGGVALQEVVAGQLTKEGQYIRRERSYEGVTVEYRVMDKSQEEDYQMPQLNLAEIHTAYCDRITEIIREIITFQSKYVNKRVNELDEELVEQQGRAGIAKGDMQGGISNSPAFSGIFNLINQLLMAINAEATAILAIEDLKNGRKPIIALANTMESFLDDVKNPGGDPVQVGDIININFKHVLYRRLKNALRYREDLGMGKVTAKFFTPEELGHEAFERYNYIISKIETSVTDLVFSPIDYIRKRITDAGFTFEEVTGRDRRVDILDDGTGMVVARNIRPTNVVFREFNSNQIDCLLINQSGATGVSGHAMIVPGKVDVVNYDATQKAIIPNSLEPRNEVKQRSMIIMQAELDISFEVQKRGRVNRTGQIFPPKYIYVTSAIPAQQRLLMMLQKKLKSLDANSTGNQKQSTKILDIADFLNKIGDDVVVKYLLKNPNINEMIGDPLYLMGEDGNRESTEVQDAANKVAARIAILSIKHQQEFYDTMSNMYRQEVDRLKQIDEYDLEVEFLNYRAKTLAKTVIQPADMSKKPNYFTRAVLLEKIEVDNLKKPFRIEEIKAIVAKNLTIETDGAGESIVQSVSAYSVGLIDQMKSFYETRLKNNIATINAKYDKRILAIREQGEKSRSTGNQGDIFEAEATAKKTKKKEPKPAISIEETNAAIAEMEESRVADIEDEKLIIGDTIKRNTRLFEYFVPGRVYKFPKANYAETGNYQYSIFMGFNINTRMSFGNPWAPSNIELEFAMDNSLKQINMSSTYNELDQIRSLNDNWFFENQSDIIKDWNQIIKESSADRINRYVLTGNLLKAFSSASVLGEQFGSGRLVSFNLFDDPTRIRTGYLLPNTFSLEGKSMESIDVSVPIISLIDYFKTASNPSAVLKYRSSDVLQVYISGNSITLDFKGAKADYKQYIVDKQLIDLFGTDFKISQGSAIIVASDVNIDPIVTYLWDQYKITVKVSQAMAESMGINLDVEYDDAHAVVDPTNEINADFQQAIDARKKEEAEVLEREKQEEMATKARMGNLVNAEKELQAQKLLDQFIKMLMDA